MSDSNLNRGLKEDGSPYSVLLVDDSLFVTKQLTRIFESEGFKILATASHGREAVEKYVAYHPDIDLVTMDITMPGMDGVSALEEIIQFDGDATVVMVTALGNKDLVKRSLLSGAEAYLVKPFEKEKVLCCVDGVLNGNGNH